MRQHKQEIMSEPTDIQKKEQTVKKRSWLPLFAIPFAVAFCLAVAPASAEAINLSGISDVITGFTAIIPDLMALIVAIIPMVFTLAIYSFILGLLAAILGLIKVNL
jgi:hypothetical protein